MIKKRNLLFFLFITVFSLKLFCQNKIAEENPSIILQKNRFPKLSQLKSNDELFKEYSFIVADNYKSIAAGKLPDFIFFLYQVEDKQTSLLSLASRCNIPYDTIATLNQLENSQIDLYGKKLLLPTSSGLFIPTAKAKNSLEYLLQEKYSNQLTQTDLEKQTVKITIDGQEFLFLINQRFSPTQRAYFLDSQLGLPLAPDTYWISSTFGKRKNPISGKWKNHNGIDLAAAEGTPVYSIKSGIISHIVFDDKTFGNYIIISHDEGKTTSVYAHLSKVTAKKNSFVSKGELIGYVGSTGLVTGPHLHFEIRQGGIAQNPQTKLNLE